MTDTIKTWLQFKSSYFKINVHRWMVRDKGYANTKTKLRKKRHDQICQDTKLKI